MQVYVSPEELPSEKHWCNLVIRDSRQAMPVFAHYGHPEEVLQREVEEDPEKQLFR